MKKSVIMLAILFLLPIISAAVIDMKSQYDQGETIIAKVSGNFYDSIQDENIFFYRGHVSSPTNYDVAKINNDYYIKASLIGKIPANYSIKIKNVRYYQGGYLTDEDIVSNFSITENTADFSIDPGFVISSQDFSIEVQNIQDNSFTIQIKTPAEIITQSSLDLGPQQIRNIDFELGNIMGDFFETIKLSTDNLEYNIPIHIYGQYYCGDGNITAGEQCDGDNWGTITGCSDFEFTNGTLFCVNCSFNTSECFNEFAEQAYCGDGNITAGEQCDGDDWGVITGCSNFGFTNGTLSCVNCSFNTSECFNTEDQECVPDCDGKECGDNGCGGSCGTCDDDEECDDRECVKIEDECDDDCNDGYECDDGECVKKDNYCDDKNECDDDEECKKHECVEKEPECVRNEDCNQGDVCNKGQCINEDVAKSCDELNGSICGSNEECKGDSTQIDNYECCLGTCEEVKKSSITKIIGWLLIGVVVVLLAFFYIKYKGAKRKKPDLTKIGASKPGDIRIIGGLRR